MDPTQIHYRYTIFGLDGGPDKEGPAHLSCIQNYEEAYYEAQALIVAWQNELDGLEPA